MRWTNYHSHTLFSDGSHSPEHYIVSAIDKHMIAYGFSGHAPVPFSTDWTMKADQLGSYLASIDHLKAKYNGQIHIFKSLEIDFLPGSPMCWATTLKPLGLDYVIGSVHFVDKFPDGSAWNIDFDKALFDKGVTEIFGGNLQAAVERFYELSEMMVSDMQPDIVGHLDKVKMFCMDALDQNASWYRSCVHKLLLAMKSAGSIMEINTRGYYKKTLKELYPSDWILKAACDMGISVTICSDSHHPSELILGFQEAAKHLQASGYCTVAVFQDGAWVEQSFSPEHGIVTG